MYRLADYQDPIVQKVVTNTLAKGLANIWGERGQTDFTKITVNNESGLDTLTYLLDTESNNTGLCDLSEDSPVLSTIADKIEKMYSELVDPDNEYTFDEFGEYLLYLHMLFSGGDGDCTHRDSIYRPYPQDELYVRNYFAEYYKEMYEDDPELWEDTSQEEFVEIMYNATIDFSNMSFQGDWEGSCVFQDTDYLFYDDISKSKIFISNLLHGTVSELGAEEREPVSGSLKFSLKEVD